MLALKLPQYNYIDICVRFLFDLCVQAFLFFYKKSKFDIMGLTVTSAAAHPKMLVNVSAITHTLQQEEDDWSAPVVYADIKR